MDVINKMLRNVRLSMKPINDNITDAISENTTTFIYVDVNCKVEGNINELVWKKSGKFIKSMIVNG